MKRYVKADTFDILEEDDDFIRRVLQDPDVRPRTLDRLADSNDAYIREWVASLLKTSPDTLAKLADDPNVVVKRAVAIHPDTPEDVLIKLAHDEDYNVREKLLSRRNLSTPVMLALLDVPDAGWTHSIHRDLTHSIDFDFQFGEIPDPEVVIKLAQDPDKDVREWVAGWGDNMKLPREVFDILVNDKDKNVRRRMLDSVEPEHIPEDVRIKLAGDPETYVRRAASLYTLLPDECYWQLAKDSDRTVRSSLTHNPYVPDEILEYLLKDEEPIIREHAQKKLDRRSGEL